jgi:GT2 family glycosyltransferase
MENKNPLVSIIILSYNRCSDLEYTLQRVFEQEYSPYEVLVVDNNSTDGSAAMVKENFPSVILIPLTENTGIAGWNEGARVAKGQYFFMLDDDSYPLPDTLSRAYHSLHERTIIALDIRHPSQPDVTYSSLIQSTYPTFIGCGVIIPRTVFFAVGGFEPLLFLYAHEEEFAMRALQSGYTVQFLQGSVVYHRRSLKNRQRNMTLDKQRIYFKTRNSIILLLLHFPLSRAIPRICRMGIGRILFSMTHRCVGTVIKSMYDGMAVSIRHWNKRLVLDEDVQRQFGYGIGLGSFFAGGDTGFRRPRWL